MNRIILKISNPTTKQEYGRWDLKVLIRALSDPLHFDDPAVAMCLRADLAVDELQFEIVD